MNKRAIFITLVAATGLVRAAEDNTELSRQATDPTASLMALNFQGNPQYNLQNDRGLDEWSVTFTFTALFPTF